jgi:hypothetical protein
MPSYLDEMHFAVEQVLDGLWNERKTLERLQAEIATLTNAVQQTYARADMIAQDALDAEDVMLATGMFWDNYWGDDKERHGKVKTEAELQASWTLSTSPCRRWLPRRSNTRSRASP